MKLHSICILDGHLYSYIISCLLLRHVLFEMLGGDTYTQLYMCPLLFSERVENQHNQMCNLFFKLFLQEPMCVSSSKHTYIGYRSSTMSISSGLYIMLCPSQNKFLFRFPRSQTISTSVMFIKSIISICISKQFYYENIRCN